MLSAGETEAGSAEEQLARDSQPGWRNTVRVGLSAHPLSSKGIFDSLMPKKTSCQRQVCLLIVKGICPIPAEPIQADNLHLPLSIIDLYFHTWNDLSFIWESPVYITLNSIPSASICRAVLVFSWSFPPKVRSRQMNFSHLRTFQLFPPPWLWLSSLSAAWWFSSMNQ